MTDDKKTKRDEDELVLDWDDAVDSWDKDFASSASSEAAPFPLLANPVPTRRPGTSTSPGTPPAEAGSGQSAEPRKVPPAKPMYKPPSADEIRALRSQKERPAPAARPVPAHNDWDDGVDENDGVDDTRIAAIPRELIESLARLETTDRELNVRSISVVPDREVDNLSISIDESDFNDAAGPHDTDPSGLDGEHEGSGVFSPALSRPASTTVRPTKPSLEPEPYAFRGRDENEEDENTRVLDLAEVDFGDARPWHPKNATPVSRGSLPPPVPAGSSREEVSVLRNLEELAPPAAKTVPPPKPQVSLAPSADRGAATALRTVRTRKPHVEDLPLVGGDERARRGRAALLKGLAARRSGRPAAQLLTQAAALHEEIADAAGAATLYAAALKAEPTLSEARRGQARLLLQAGDLNGYATALEQQANLTLPASEKAQLLYSLALLRWLAQRDQPNALRAAAAAALLLPDDVACAALLARLELASHSEGAGAAAQMLAAKVHDKALVAVLKVIAGRTLFDRGEYAPALAAFSSAIEHDASAFDAQIGSARTLIAMGSLDAAAAHLTVAAEETGGALGGALRRQAARLHGTDESKLEVGARLLLDAQDPLALRTASQLAMRAGVDELKNQVVDAWTRTSHGRDRALAQITLAELRSASGDSEACEEALQAANRADPQLALVPVVREVLARRRGDSAKLAEMSASDSDSILGPLAAAAKLARDNRNTREQELAWLERAHQNGAELACVDAILLDASAELSATDLMRSALRGSIERSSIDQRVGPTLALADVERRRGNESLATELIAEVAASDARNTLASRAVLRQTTDSATAARLWRKEGDSAQGARAAFAHLRAAHALSDDLQGRLAAFVAAHEVAPGYIPATWALHHEARRQGDLARLAELHSRETGRSKDPLDAVGHLVRAALIRANDDADGAAAQLARALDLTPGDPVLRELVLRLGDAVPATLRAEAMQRTAEHAPESLKRAALLAAAGAFEDAHQPAHAEQLYSSVLERHPDDPIAEMGYERVAPLAGKLDELLARRTAAVDAAVTPAARVKALEELIALDRGAPPEVSVERARAVLELEPRHPLSLRLLERVAMEHNDVVALANIEARMLETSVGPRDKAARLRVVAFAHAQGLTDPNSTEFDALLLGPGLDAAANPWIARQLMGAAVAAHHQNGIERANELLFEACSEPIEIASSAIVRARDQRRDTPDEVLRQLEQGVAKYPAHPVADEAMAEALLRAGDLEGAAERFEGGAKTARGRTRIARLWYRAGRLWQDELRAPDRARDAFRAAAESDIAYADVQARLESLLSGRNDLAGLITLTEARLQTDGPPDQIAEVHRSLAKLQEKKGDRAAARVSLRNALSVAPEHLATLRDFAQLCERDQEWRECAEALIRLARLSRDPGELREVFFRLGEVYDIHLPDPRRAEAAYRRVLKLGPKHAKALERLAALYQREGQHELAIEALERLAQVAETVARRRDVAFELARLKEAHGDGRGAEETLETLRKTAPTDLYVLRGLADFYRRQNASTALAMHLNRAANDLRAVLAEDLDDAALWTALVEVLDQRGRRDAAGACASTAFALGLADAGVVAHTDKEGGIPGVGGAAFSELLDDLLYPQTMNPAVRVLFRHAAEALNKAAPFDVRMLGGEKLDKKHALRGTTQEVARWMSVADVEIYVTEQLPYAFVPIQDSPVALLVGKTLLDTITRGEAQFLSARALKIARAQMSLCCRIRPDDLGVMMHALIRAHAPDYAPYGVDIATMEDMGRRIAKHLSRKAREELLPHLVELESANSFDPARVYEMASTAASRAGLLATGSVPSAATALCKLAGMASSARHNTIGMTQIAEARDLLLFAVSEAHFEARQRAGVDRR